MIVREAKLKNGTREQYCALDEAIRTAQFIRNKAVRFWMDNADVSKAILYVLGKDIACIALSRKSSSQPPVKPVPNALGLLYLASIAAVKKARKGRVILNSKSTVALYSTRCQAGN